MVSRFIYFTPIYSLFMWKIVMVNQLSQFTFHENVLGFVDTFCSVWLNQLWYSDSTNLTDLIETGIQELRKGLKTMNSWKSRLDGFDIFWSFKLIMVFWRSETSVPKHAGIQIFYGGATFAVVPTRVLLFCCGIVGSKFEFSDIYFYKDLHRSGWRLKSNTLWSEKSMKNCDGDI